MGLHFYLQKTKYSHNYLSDLLFLRKHINMEDFIKYNFKFNVMDNVTSNFSNLEGIITKRYLSEPIDFVVGENEVSILEETYDVYELGTFSVDELNAKSI